MTDQSIKQRVLDELNWEPSINAAHVGVTARDGVVTMTGHVGSYAEKCAAECAAERVSGVKATPLERQVRIWALRFARIGPIFFDAYGGGMRSEIG
jgi:hypothetical protein